MCSSDLLDCRRVVAFACPGSLMKKFLSRWLPTVAALAAFALAVSLGNWQMRRAEEKAAAQRLLDAAQASGPVRLDGAALADPRKLSGMRVELTGRFQDRYTIFIDNRSYRGRAGFHVLTPFNSDSLDRPVLVLRGWVPQDPAQRSRLPALPEIGRAHV